MTVLALIAGLVFAVIALLHAVPWLLLGLIALPRPRGAPSPPGDAQTRIAVLVPAHNEERMIAATVNGLLAATHTPVPEVIVVADNCSDRTAAVASAAGATVFERHDASRRGKSYALDFGLERLAARGRPPEVVAVVDADTLVEPGFFTAIAVRMAGGADAVQVHYAPLPAAGSLPALRRLAFALVHWARPLGAARLGLGVGLKGNGMAFRWEVVRDGFGASGLAEDAALTLELARRGTAVRFEPGTTVRGAMADSYGAAGTQDRRWEAGRLGLAAAAFGQGLRSAAHGRFACAWACLELAMLPMTLVAVCAVLGSALLVLGGVGWSAAVPVVTLVAACAVAWAAARVPPRDLLALAAAPRFALHKLRVLSSVALHRGPATWERTSREAPR